MLIKTRSLTLSTGFDTIKVLMRLAKRREK